MIEKKSEVSPITINENGSYSDLSDHEGYINKKREESKNGHGEDISIKMLNLFPELYSERIFSSPKKAAFSFNMSDSMSQRYRFDVLVSNTKKYSSSLIFQPENNESKASYLAQSVAPALPETSISAETTNHAKEVAYTGDDKIMDKPFDTTKTYSVINTVRHDLTLQRHESRVHEPKHRTLQPPIVDRVLQAHARLQTEPAVMQKKPLDIDYPFLRWSGEHSVKVSIAVGESRGRNLVLLPSDYRAAEVLSRQVNQLSDYAAELLQPQQDDEGSERIHARQGWEEDQE